MYIYSQNGIAEAFNKFAYDNKLSFAPTEEELNQIMHPENELPFWKASPVMMYSTICWRGWNVQE